MAGSKLSKRVKGRTRQRIGKRVRSRKPRHSSRKVGGVNYSTPVKIAELLRQNANKIYITKGAYGVVFEMILSNTDKENKVVTEHNGRGVHNLMLKLGLLYEDIHDPTTRQRLFNTPENNREVNGARQGRVFQLTGTNRVLQRPNINLRLKLGSGADYVDGREREINSESRKTFFLTMQGPNAGRKEIMAIHRQRFNQEYEDHLKIYLIGLEDNVQICPSILYAGEHRSDALPILMEQNVQSSTDRVPASYWAYDPATPVPISAIIMEKFSPWLRQRCQQCSDAFYTSKWDTPVCKDVKCTGPGFDRDEEEILKSARLLLFYLGTKGYSHGDISVNNIMKKYNSKFNEAILIDFNLHKLSDVDTSILKSIWQKRIGHTEEMKNGKTSKTYFMNSDFGYLNFKYESGPKTGEDVHEADFIRDCILKGEHKNKNIPNYDWLRKRPFVIGKGPVLWAGYEKLNASYTMPKLYETRVQYARRTLDDMCTNYDETVKAQKTTVLCGERDVSEACILGEEEEFDDGPAGPDDGPADGPAGNDNKSTNMKSAYDITISPIADYESDDSDADDYFSNESGPNLKSAYDSPISPIPDYSKHSNESYDASNESSKKSSEESSSEESSESSSSDESPMPPRKKVRKLTKKDIKYREEQHANYLRQQSEYNDKMREKGESPTPPRKKVRKLTKKDKTYLEKQHADYLRQQAEYYDKMRELGESPQSTDY